MGAQRGAVGFRSWVPGPCGPSTRHLNPAQFLHPLRSDDPCCVVMSEPMPCATSVRLRQGLKTHAMLALRDMGSHDRRCAVRPSCRLIAPRHPHSLYSQPSDSHCWSWPRSSMLDGLRGKRRRLAARKKSAPCTSSDVDAASEDGDEDSPAAATAKRPGQGDPRFGLRRLPLLRTPRLHVLKWPDALT